MTDIRRIHMRKIRDVLRLHLKGRLSQRQIAAALGISKGVVAKYISLATQLGLGWDDIAQLSETELERRLIPPTPPPEYFVRPDFGHLHHLEMVIELEGEVGMANSCCCNGKQERENCLGINDKRY